MSRMLVITPFFYPHLGGSERYIEQLYSAVLHLDNTIQVDVLTYNTNHGPKQESYRGMTIYRLGCVELLTGQFALPNYFELIRVLRRLKRQGGYQVVNAHSRFFESSWWGWIAARYFKAKAVLTDHCADHPVHSHFLVRRFAELVDHLMIPWLGKKYDLITVVSQATRIFLQRHGMTQVIEVVPNSVEIVVPPKRFRRKEVMISFVGRHITSKGADLFAAVADRLRPEYPWCTFIQVSGESHEYVMEHLGKTDILLHPSRHHEGLPTVILEAGMMGCAVAATNNGGTGEVIHDGETGMLVKAQIEDLVMVTRRLILDADLRLRLGVNLRKKVIAAFSWQQTAHSYLELIHALSQV